jgi:hypothetical protein
MHSPMRYVHKTRGTAHAESCVWLQGAFAGVGKTKPDHYAKVAARQVHPDAPRCSYCAKEM